MRVWQKLGLLAVVGSAAMVTMAARQQRPTFTPEQEARLRIREVTEGLYLIPGFDGGQSGGNVAVRVTDEGVIIVDNKFPYSFDFITEQVANVTSQPVRYVLNTHHHDDHSGSNADFMESANVIAHKNARINIVRNEQPGALRASRYEYEYESSHFLDRSNLRVVPGRSIQSLAMTVVFGILEFSGEIRNITDNQIADIWGYPLPGRSFFVTVSKST